MECVGQDCINVQVAKNANTSTVRGDHAVRPDYHG